jgi:tetratricopeptide (TPR) repeat protein
MDEAVTQLEAAVKIDGNNRDARARLAQAYLQTGRYIEAYQHAQIAIDLIESSPSNTIERSDRARMIRDLALRKLFEQERARQAATTQSSRP